MQTHEAVPTAVSPRFSGSGAPPEWRKASRYGGSLRTVCPHCRSQAKCRSSRELTPLFREIRYQCMDIECGHTFVASLTIDRTIVQSAKPNPRIKLPIGQPRPPTPANDDEEPVALEG